MKLDSNLKIEIISSLLGQNIQPYDKKKRGRIADVLSVDEFHLHNLTGKGRANAKQTFIKEEDFFDPEYDCDFTDISGTAECSRGNELYERPKGWYRLGLKVKGKYTDGDDWLGTAGFRSHSVPGEWPVSYHGTSLDGATGIIKSHYNAGPREMYGRGIYSTPDIRIAEREEYAKTFTSKTTGKSYKVILQNRINPRKREVCRRSDYWLIPVKDGTSAKQEKKLVESSIRPYGILIKELNDDGDGDGDDNGDGEEENYGDYYSDNNCKYDDATEDDYCYEDNEDDEDGEDGDSEIDDDGDTDQSADDDGDGDEDEDEDEYEDGDGGGDDDDDGDYDDGEVDDTCDDDGDSEHGDGDGDDDNSESDDNGNADEPCDEDDGDDNDDYDENEDDYDGDNDYDDDNGYDDYDDGKGYGDYDDGKGYGDYYDDNGYDDVDDDGDWY